MDTYQKWSLVGLWLGSIGTVGAVVYALFGAAMRRWVNKPNLEFDISGELPYCSLLKRGGTTESNSELNIIEICASIINTQKFCAQHSRVVCTGIYVLEANGKTFCPFIHFRPKQFQWLDIAPERQNLEIDIGQSVKHFVKIAEISKPQNEMAANNQRIKQPQQASVTVAIPNPHKPGSSYVRIPSEHSCVLIQIQVSCSGCTPKIYNVRIDWKGNSVNEFEKPGKLSVSSLDESDVNKLISSTERRQ